MAKKAKRMTQREKDERRKVREELRAEGLLPPVKKRLNRSEFKEEALEAFSHFGEYSGIATLPRKHRNMHVALMSVAYSQTSRQISSEQIGALKVMKIAADLEKFEAKCGGSYDFEEAMEKVVQPVLDL